MKRSILIHVEYDLETGRLYFLSLPNDGGPRRSTLKDVTNFMLAEISKELDGAFVSVRNQLLSDLEPLLR